MDFSRYINVNFKFQQYTQGQLIALQCNEVTFINSGSSIATLDNTLQLQPGQSITLSGNLGELIKQSLQINFVGNTGLLNVIVKTYL